MILTAAMAIVKILEIIEKSCDLFIPLPPFSLAHVSIIPCRFSDVMTEKVQIDYPVLITFPFVPAVCRLCFVCAYHNISRRRTRDKKGAKKEPHQRLMSIC